METISLKMEKKLLQDVDSSLKKHRYSTRTEFLRDAVRSKLTQLEKDEAIRKLEAMKGTLKPKTNLSDEEIREIVARRTAKKYGIEL